MNLRDWWERLRRGAAEAEPAPPAEPEEPEERPARPVRRAADATGAFQVGVDSQTIAIDGMADDDRTVAVEGVQGAAPSPHADVQLDATRVRDAAEGEPAAVVGVLVATHGEFRGTAWTLVAGANRIGREYSCEICLPTERMAPQHASIEYRGGSFHLEVLADAEAELNGDSTQGAVLRDGDGLRVGMTTFRFRSIVET